MILKGFRISYSLCYCYGNSTERLCVNIRKYNHLKTGEKPAPEVSYQLVTLYRGHRISSNVITALEQPVTLNNSENNQIRFQYNEIQSFEDRKKAKAGTITSISHSVHPALDIVQHNYCFRVTSHSQQ